MLALDSKERGVEPFCFILEEQLMHMDKMEIIKVSTQKLVNEVSLLANKIWRDHYTPIIGKKQVEYMLDKFQSKAAIIEQLEGGFLYFIIKEEGEGYIGYIGLIPKGDEMFLSKIYVMSEKRGKGYGRKLIGFIEQLAKKKGCSKITLTVNKNNFDAIEFYQRCGFTNSGSLVQDIGEGFVMDDHKMEKSF